MGILSGFFVVMGNMNMVAGNAEKARQFYSAAITKKSRNALPYLNCAVLLMQDGDNAAARPLLERGLALKHKPITGKNLLISLGTCLWLEKDFDGAIAAFENLRSKYSYVSAGALTTLGYIYFVKGELEKAEEITRQALSDDENNAAALDNLGQIYYSRDNFAEAKTFFEKAVSLREVPESLYYLGLIAEKEGGAAKAREYYTRALSAKITAFNTITRPQIESELARISGQNIPE